MADGLKGRRILITSDAVGGVWTYSLDLMRELSAAGMDCVLAVMGAPPGDAMLRAVRAIPRTEIVITGLPLDWQAAGSGEVLDAGRQIADLARARRCDLVQLHTPSLAAVGGFAQPVVSVLHSCLATWWRAVRPGEELPEEIGWLTALVARGMAVSDQLVVPSTALAHAAIEAYGLDATPLAVRNARAMPDIASLPEVDTRQAFAFTSGRLWDEGKNLAALDRAAARLSLPLIAAGEVTGPSGAARHFGHLRLAGRLGEEEMRRWLRGAPVYVSAARYEPFGLGVLEAAQCGCALVLSDIASFRELWSGACLFVAADDDEGFAAAIEKLLSEPALLRRMSRRARDRAGLYTVEAMAGQMMRLYSALLALHRVGQGAAA